MPVISHALTLSHPPRPDVLLPDPLTPYQSPSPLPSAEAATNPLASAAAAQNRLRQRGGGRDEQGIVPKETIEVIAQSVGISNLPADVSAALAPDAEYRLRELMQEAIKCTRHAKRTVLTADDVDIALSLRNVEPVYGFASGDPLWFKRDLAHMDLFYFDDREVDLKR
ncbi:hypothetical protein QYE76_058631 [Lolium multiflorum]|uniref:TATA box binding protein associated factor (TAF) histone-like fold domain-containing protein n=1 Tax=Lolium multiflorum TaxID=4521 RepID=A0AAD8T5Z2_LOLMU|nr:hypothetical protein QYE76_058631 [Lolium multiflorum]